MHKRDYQAPPREAYNRDGPPQDGEKKPSGKRPGFEGEAMYKRDYAAPPPEAYSQQRGPPDDRVSRNKQPRPQFQGETSQKRDFAAPPKEAYRGPDRDERDNKPQR